MCADFFFSLNFVLRKSVSTGNNELCLVIPFVVSKVFLDYFVSCFDYP